MIIIDDIIDKSNEAVGLIHAQRNHSAIAILNQILSSPFCCRYQRNTRNHQESHNSTTSPSVLLLQENNNLFTSSIRQSTTSRFVNQPDNEPHYYFEDRYDEGMSTFSQPLYIHSPTNSSSSTVDSISVRPVVYFNLGIAHSRLNVPDSQTCDFFQKSFDLLAKTESSMMVFFENERSFSIPLLRIALLNIGHNHWLAGHRDKAGRIYRSLLLNSLSSEEIDGVPHEIPTSSILVDDHNHHRVTLSNLAPEENTQFRSAVLNCVAVAELYILGQSGQNDGHVQNTSYCLELLSGALSYWTGSGGSSMTKQNDVKEVPPTRQSATILNNIGRVHFISNDIRNALSFYNRALHQRRSLLGEESLDVATTRVNIAQCYEAMGDYPNATSYYERCLSVVTSRLESGNEDLIRILINLGENYIRNGNLEKAKTVLKQALQHSKCSSRSPLDNFGVVAMIWNKLGNVEYDLDENEAALQCYISGLELERQIYTDRHMNIVVTIMNIARVHQKLGSLDFSRTCLEEALHIANDAEDDGGFRFGGVLLLADIHSSLATILEAQRDYPRAIQELERALEIEERTLGSIHFQTSLRLHSLALLQFNAGERHTAVISMLRCLKIRQRILPTDPSILRYLITAYYNAASLCRSIGENHQALKFFEIILTLENKASDTNNTNNKSSSPPSHDNQVETLTQMFLVCEELDEVQRGLKYLVNAARLCSEHKQIIDRRKAFLVYRLLGDTHYFHYEEIESAMKNYSFALRMFGWDGCDTCFSIGQRHMQAAWFSKRVLTCYAAGTA